MKKCGNWIATFGPNLKVSRVNVEPSEALDLVQVVTVDRLAGEVTNIFYFDRAEGAALREALGRALDRLELVAIDEANSRSGDASDHPRASTAEP